MPTEQLLVKLNMDAGQYKREATDAATATGKIGTEAGTATTATGKMSSGLNAVGTVAKVAVAGAAAAAVTSFAKDSIRAATDLNESINAVNVTFGDAAPAILAIGETSAESFGLAQSEFNAFAVQFSNFATTIATGSGRQVEDVVSELTGRISDFASVMNIDVPEAAEKFQSGLAGQVEPLRKYGIDVSAAATTQRALELGLADTTSELTEQDKVMARYSLIMEQTDKTAGDFKNTQEDLANATRTMNAQLEDFKAQVGSLATGALADFVSTGSDMLTILNGIGDAIGGAEAGIGGLISALVDALPFVGAFRDVVGWLADAFDDEKTAIDEVNISTADMADHAASLEGELDALRGTVRNSIRPTNDLTTSVEALKAAEERQERATRLAKEALWAKHEAIRNIHNPIFRMVELNLDLVEAEEAVNAAATAPGGVGSPEHQEALIKQARIIEDLEGTYMELKEQGIDPTGAAARLAFEEAHFTDEMIADIFAQFDRIRTGIEARTIRISMSIPTFDVNQGGGVRRTGEKVIRGQHGGIFEPRPGGHFVNIGEAGSREGVLPFNKEGIGILAAALKEAGGGAGGGHIFNMYGGTEAMVNEVIRRVALEMRLVS